MESHVEKVRKVFKKNGFNDKDIYKLASVLSKLEAEVGSQCHIENWQMNMILITT